VAVGACLVAVIGTGVLVCVAIVTEVGDLVGTGCTTSVAVILVGSVMTTSVGVAVGRGLYISPAAHHANNSANKITDKNR